MYVVDDGRIGVDDGVIWVEMSQMQSIVGAAVRENEALWRKRLIGDQERADKRILELTTQNNLLHSKWVTAEQRNMRLDRAEEAMREYEATIAEKMKEISDLTSALATAKLVKSLPKKRGTSADDKAFPMSSNKPRSKGPV